MDEPSTSKRSLVDDDFVILTSMLTVDDNRGGGAPHAFETRYCMLFALYGFIKQIENMELRFQVNQEEIGKLDDIWFNDGKTVYNIQMKHVSRKKGEITGTMLFSKTYDDPFNLLKYVDSVHKFIKGKNKAMILTTTTFNIDNEDKIKLKNFQGEGKQWVKGIKEIKLEPEEVDEFLTWCNSSVIKDDVFTGEAKTKKRKHESSSESEIEKKEQEKKGIQCYKLTDDNVATILERQSKKKEVTDEPKTKKKKLESLSKKEIEQALKHIVYVVNVPDDSKVEEIITNKLKYHFLLHDPNAVYDPLQRFFINWCNNKKKLLEIQKNQHVIQFNDIKEFFQNNAKTISFGELSLISPFTGRIKQLEKMRKNLKEDLIISQSLKISGLGGIGKTSLVKKFIELYGKTDFYGRVIWIQAESNETVANSFKSLAEKIKIKDREKNSIKTIIDDIFEYFQRFKVLFVFDNYDNYPETNQKENLVVYCRDIASNPNKIDRPYFIYTSRNRDCLPKRGPKVAVINLDILTEEDACKLIKDGLENQNVNDEDVKALAKLLQYFPLALQQAVAFIEYEREARQAAGENNYELKNYIELFNKKSEVALSFDKFDEFEKTSFITWNVTIDAIKKDEYGDVAIEILQYMSYLYADRINAKIFSTLNNDDYQVGKALLLLSKYSMITGESKEENKEEKMVYQIHRLVQKVIQLQYKSEEMAEKVWKLIDPKNYEYCKEKTAYHIQIYRLRNCDSDTYLHYLSIFPLVEEYHDLHEKITTCVDSFNGTHIERAFENNDEETLAQIPKQSKIAFANKNIESCIKKHENTTAKLLLKYVDKDKSNLYLKESLGNYNIEIFKILFDKGANLNELNLEYTVIDVIRGKSDSVKVLLDQERSESNKNILQECLFFASGFNHKEIVELLMNSNVEINFWLRYFSWAPIFAAIQCKCYDILKILLKYFDNKSKETLEDFIKFVFSKEWNYYKEFQIDKTSFQIIVEKYLEIVVDINHIIRTPFDDDSCSLLFLVTDEPFFLPEYENIVIFLLEKGANPLIVERNNESALLNLLVITKKYGCLKNAYKKKRLEIPDEEFSNMCRDYLFYEIHKGSINEEFFIVLEEIKDKNIRNENGKTLLIYYLNIYIADKDVVEKLIKAGVDVDAKDNSGKNALYYSLDVLLLNDHPYKTILKNTKEIDDELPNYYIKSLFKSARHDKIETTFLTILDKISDKNVRNENGETLLITYLKKRSLKYAYSNFAELVIKAGVDVDAKDNNGKNALYYSLDVLNDEPYKTILKYSQEIDDELPNYYIKILFKAAQHGNIQTTFFTILDKITDKNVRNENGETLLITYLKNRCSDWADDDFAEKVIKAGVDVDAKDNNAKNALYYSLDVINDEPYKTILKYSQEIDDELPNYYIKILFKAAQHGNIQTTFFTILDKITDKNVRNENGETLLITYLKNRCSKEADFIYEKAGFIYQKADFSEKVIKAGVDVDAKDNNGKNALYYSLDVINDEPYKTILKYSQEIDDELPNYYIKSLFKAAQHGNIQTTFFTILDKVTDKNVRNDNGETLLITYLKNRCSERANTDLAEKVIKAGVDVDAKDNNGKNALYYSLDVLNDEPYKTILKHSQEIDDELPNYYIKSLFKAAQNGEIRTTFYTILDKISDKNVRNENGETLLITYLKNKSLLYTDLEEDKTNAVEIVEKILKAGVDVNATDNSGNNAHYYSSKIENDKFRQTISKYFK